MHVHLLATLVTSLGTSVAGTFVIFHAALLAIALVVYSSIDFAKHFTVPEDARLNFGTLLYFSATLSATFSCPNDIVPRSQLGRGLVSLHALISWLQSVLVIFLSAATRAIEREAGWLAAPKP